MQRLKGKGWTGPLAKVSKFNTAWRRKVCSEPAGSCSEKENGTNGKEKRWRHIMCLKDLKYMPVPLVGSFRAQLATWPVQCWVRSAVSIVQKFFHPYFHVVLRRQRSENLPLGCCPGSDKGKSGPILPNCTIYITTGVFSMTGISIFPQILLLLVSWFLNSNIRLSYIWSLIRIRLTPRKSNDKSYVITFFKKESLRESF